MPYILRLVQEIPLGQAGAEEGVGSWAFAGDAPVQSNTVARSGTYSMKFGDTTPAYGQSFIYQSRTCNAGEVYHFSWWVYLPSANPAYTVANIAVHSPLGTPIAVTTFVSQANATRNSWFRVEVTVTIQNTGTHYFLLQFDNANAGAYSQYADDARLYLQLVDFQATNNYLLKTWSISALGQKFARSPFSINIIGSSADNVFDNLINLFLAFQLAAKNYDTWENGGFYNAVYLQFRHVNGSTLIQAECFGVPEEELLELQNLIQYPDKLLANRIEFDFNLLHRGYFEEQSPINVSGSPFTVANTAAPIDIPATLRGDLPAPLYIKVRTPSGSQDQIIAALRSEGTPANFVCWYDINGAGTYAARGANVADLNDSSLSPGGGGVTAQRWTPAVTSEQQLVLVDITNNIGDKMGRALVLGRVRDNKGTKNTKSRARGAIKSGSTYQYGAYGDDPKYVLTAQGTTAISLLNYGILNFPAVDTGGVAPQGMAVEFRAQALVTGGGNEFDIDGFFVLPIAQGGNESGLVSAILPTVMGTGAEPDGVINAHDRIADAYLEQAGTLRFPMTDIRGKPLYAWPELAQRLYVLTLASGTGRHTWNANNTVTLWYTPRYRVAAGS